MHTMELPIIRPLPSTNHLIKNPNRKPIRHSLIPLPIQMQIITRVVLAQQPVRGLWIAHHLIKVHHGIKRPAIANPRIDTLSRALPLRIGIRLRIRVLRWRGKRRDRRPDDGDAGRMEPRRDLSICADQVRAEEVLRFGVCCGDADVVDAFEENGALHARVAEYVAVESAQNVRAEPVG